MTPPTTASHRNGYWMAHNSTAVQGHPRGGTRMNGVPVCVVLRAWFFDLIGLRQHPVRSSLRQVSKFDVFISHPWCISRMNTFLSLAFVYGTGFPFFLSFSLCAVLRYAGCRVSVCLVAGWFSWLGGFICDGVFSRNNTTVFLDKYSIDQLDNSEKQESIRSMREFLEKSDEILILWSSVYNTRLWCVYEMACFLKDHHIDKVDMMPVTLFASKVITAAIEVVYWSARTALGGEYGLAIDLTYAALYGVQVCEDLMPSVICLRSDISEVDVDRLQCTVSQDRDTLVGDIKRIYGSFASFKEHVRTSFKTLLATWSTRRHMIRCGLVFGYTSALVTFVTGRFSQTLLIFLTRASYMSCVTQGCVGLLRLGLRPTKTLARVSALFFVPLHAWAVHYMWEVYGPYVDGSDSGITFSTFPYRAVIAVGQLLILGSWLCYMVRLGISQKGNGLPMKKLVE
ncbi:hypothetical protein FOZ61_003198 [Perkinsus olseni]|uniref:TIR domain-containing protein n=1 Tax=Perkinsus olseni TaxID=32597 RepID=A0A7J6M585_PEROL|nr:hypothetical protein FOZ61_003198 [Perkinsus olseni]KAF4666677.1 hypothetical protein FOL46_002900 [Perkinsus olseni]